MLNYDYTMYLLLWQDERYRDDYHTAESEYYRAPAPTAGVYGYSAAVPPKYDDVVKNYQQSHQK